MLDFARIGLPSIEIVEGVRWCCVYLVSSDDDHTFYLAVPACDDDSGKSMPLPQPCSLVAVPHLPAIAEMRRKISEQQKKAAAAKDRQGL